MPRIMPLGRSYGTIGPNLFGIWQKKTDRDAALDIPDKQTGIVNGHEWPASMIRCHEGHLVGLLSAARYNIRISQQHIAVVWLRVLLGEKKYFSQMRFRDIIMGVFNEAEQLAKGPDIASLFAESDLEPVAWFNGTWGDLPEESKQSPAPSLPTNSCVIATACTGPYSETIGILRRIRDNGIMADPLIRDFFHIFWSRYYEWSPGVARIAERDPLTAASIRWAFIEPWLAWMEIVTLVGSRPISELSDLEKSVLLQRINDHLHSWIAELPLRMEEKCPNQENEVFAAFQKFRELALHEFINVKPLSG